MAEVPVADLNLGDKVELLELFPVQVVGIEVGEQGGKTRRIFVAVVNEKVFTLHMATTALEPQLAEQVVEATKKGGKKKAKAKVGAEAAQV